MQLVRRTRGFTLIELLVVIAIIAILAAILFPVFISAKERANMSRCLENLKQIHRGLVIYADDFGGYYPPARSWSDWAGYLYPKVITTPHVFDDPAIKSIMTGYPYAQKVPRTDVDQDYYYMGNEKGAGAYSGRVLAPRNTNRAKPGLILVSCLNFPHMQRRSDVDMNRGYMNIVTTDGHCRSLDLRTFGKAGWYNGYNYPGWNATW